MASDGNGMNKEEQNIDDVEFIFQEVTRFAQMPVADMKRYLRENPYNIFTTLSKRSGGILFCGRAAYYRFDELADRTIKKGSVEAKAFDRRDYVRALRDAFVEIFVEKGNTVNPSSVARMVNKANQIVKKEMVEVTHHIPCILFYEKEPATFTVGPVTFTRTEKFLTDFEHAIEVYHESSLSAFADGLHQRKPVLSEDEITARAKGFADNHIGKIRTYYTEYDWVASVAIPPCHGSLSKSRAERTVDAALDVLRLFVPSYPERYRRANVPNAPSDMCELTSDQSGHIHPTMRYEGRGAPAGDGWYTAILKDADDLWHLFEQAIDDLRDEQKSDELNKRLLDAVNWFGQAVVETNPAAKVVKYAAAIERLTITGHIDLGIEKIVIQRTTFLNKDRTDKTVDQIKEDLGKFYQCRSDLMHGSMSPYSPEVSGVLRIAWEISRWALLNAAQLFACLRANGKISRRDLGTAYDEFSEEPKKSA